MSKIIEATCVGKVVTADSVPVPAADILSEGVGSSQGVLLLDEDLAKYVTSNASDIKSALEKIASALGSIASALTAIDLKPSGSGPPAPAAAGDITSITSVQTQLTVLKGMLK
jgi:hypothetical protein